MIAMAMSPTVSGSVEMMTAMMVPSAVPALARSARENEGILAAPRFAASYFGIWVLVAVLVWLLYRPPGDAVAGALLVGAGLYELTPLKRECRRRCREHQRSGLRFGAYCFGSSIGLMLALVAIDVMSVPLMCAVAAVVLAQKLLPPNPALDVPLAVAITAAGVAVVAI